MMAAKRPRGLGSHRNADGTYNGVSLFAALTGLSQAEIRWTWDRMRDLVKSGCTGAQAKEIIKEEAKAKPWEERG